MGVEVDDGQGGHLLHRLRLCQMHAICHQLGRQFTAKAVAGQGVEVLRAHALSGERAAQVVERSAQARQVAAIGSADQVNERLASDGDLDRRGLMGGGNSHGREDKAGNKTATTRALIRADQNCACSAGYSATKRA